MKRSLLFIFILLMTPPLWAGNTKKLSLMECYRQSLETSEALGIREEDIHVASAHYLQALGTVLPQLNATGSETIQDTKNNSSSVSGTLTDHRRHTTALSVTQPLFQGFREFSALKISHVEKEKNQFLVQHARNQLFADVAKAYYTILALEDELSIQQSILSSLNSRKMELKERVSLGRSRESDQMSTEAQAASAQAEIERLKGLVQNSRDMLGFLIGKPVTEKLMDEFPVPSKQKPIEDYLADLNARPDVEATQAQAKLAKGQLNYEKGGLLPKADFIGNYYPYRSGFQKDIKWDVNFNVTFPIFDGGTTYGLIQESKAALKKAELTHQESSRQAELELRQAYNTLTSSLKQLWALKNAAAKAQTTFTLLTEEYRSSLVNNLDVLDALHNWQERRLEASLAFFQTKLNYLNLIIASGKNPGDEKLKAEKQP